MSSIDLEYAIKQDIRNNPVVREVDRDQKREFGRTLLHAAAVVGMLMFVLWPKTSRVASGYEIEKLRMAVADELRYQRQYRLEYEMLTRPEELQKRALRELRMVEPTERNTMVIERVPAGARADRAIVAAVR